VGEEGDLSSSSQQTNALTSKPGSLLMERTVLLVTMRAYKTESIAEAIPVQLSTLPHQRANKCQEEPLPNPSILPTAAAIVLNSN
jgi:hypothetical protein